MVIFSNERNKPAFLTANKNFLTRTLFKQRGCSTSMYISQPQL